jgi:hypothetical protein
MVIQKEIIFLVVFALDNLKKSIALVNKNKGAVSLKKSAAKYLMFT